jgi:FMN reductase
MALVVAISGSPSATSRTLLLIRDVAARLARTGFEVEVLNVRDLPAADLIGGQADTPEIKRALALIERADGIVVATPIYKAAYAGTLKVFLDLLPQYALAGKIVLPLATGGTIAHVLAIDYALRPVLASLGARHVLNGLFLLDKQVERREPEGVRIDDQVEARLGALVDEFAAAVRAGRP